MYINRNVGAIEMRRLDGTTCKIPAEIFHRAVETTHDVIDKFADFGVDVFSILGMRNLSAFIGELYGAAAIKVANGIFEKNPHQDGYPDLLFMDGPGKAHWQQLKDRSREKGPFSPFKTGGIEVKATCGSLPTPNVCQRRGFQKPGLGEQRISCMVGYDWKAHHRETNNLIGILWDFIDCVPRIVAVFYASNLTNEDWGRIIQPREGGGRTTSVSIMSRQGIAKMYRGWLCFRRDERYVRLIDSFNAGNLLTQALKSSS